MYDLNTCMLYGIFLSTLLYGAHVTLFILSIYVLAFKKGPRRKNVVLIAISSLMFLLETGVIALSFSRILDGFISSPNSIDTAVYFAELSLPKYMAHSALLGINVILADALLIYRCWIVYNRRVIFVLVNIALWITSVVFLAITLGRLKEVVLSTPETLQVVSTSDWTWVALSLTQTILTTAMIVYRILWVHYARSRPEEKLFQSVARIILESGTLYMITLVVYAITIHVEEGVLSNITVDILNSMLGISLSLVIVRIGLGMSQISGLESDEGSTSVSQPDSFTVPNPNERREDLEAGPEEKGGTSQSDRTSHHSPV